MVPVAVVEEIAVHVQRREFALGQRRVVVWSRNLKGVAVENVRGRRCRLHTQPAQTREGVLERYSRERRSVSAPGLKGVELPVPVLEEPARTRGRDRRRYERQGKGVRGESDEKKGSPRLSTPSPFPKSTAVSPFCSYSTQPTYPITSGSLVSWLCASRAANWKRTFPRPP